jgi:hypothetical protein
MIPPENTVNIDKGEDITNSLQLMGKAHYSKTLSLYLSALSM